ncbi:histone deacetylase [Ranunculus cassubicifolius]
MHSSKTHLNLFLWLILVKKSGQDASRMVGYVRDNRMLKHRKNSGYHIERPERLTAIWEAMELAKIPERCRQIEAVEATDEQLAKVHSNLHLNEIIHWNDLSGEERNIFLEKLNNKSVYVNDYNVEAARLAAGSVLTVAKEVLRGHLASAVALVRPPGHHAECEESMGFCVFNNVAVAAKNIIDVLIVDWDVHHGNGVQNIFWKDPRVLYLSVHRYDNGNFYPSTEEGNFDRIGEDIGEGYNINVPLTTASGHDADYVAIWDRILIPIAKLYNPDIVLISAGFDAGNL